MFKHIAIGLFIPYCIFLFFYIKNGFRTDSKTLAKLPFLLLLCAIWSFLPNILNKLHLWPLNVIANNFFISNIFFFHGILRKLHTTGASWGLGIIFLIFLSLMLIFTRHLRTQEREIRKYVTRSFN
jgi:hypothetical protein